MILIIILSGCVTKTYKRVSISLPEMPLAGEEVAKELESVCTSEKCINFNRWLNELYKFRVKYLIYKEQLKN